MGKKIEFDANKKVTKPFEAKFKTRGGGKVDFLAGKKAHVPVHTKFTVKNPSR